MGALILAVMGCAQTASQLGHNAMKQKNYYLAESRFQEALAANPQDWAARRGLGLAYYGRGEYDQAARELETVRQQMPADGQTSLYLGLTRERLADFAAAEQVYSRYVALDNSSQLARRIRGRLLYVQNEKARQQVQQAIQFDQPLIGDAGGARVVGVLPFIPVGEDAERLDPLAVGLAALVVDDLFRIGSIKLVERMQLNYILDELALAGDSVVDVSSAPRLNRLIGAGYLVRGDLVSLDNEEVGIHSGVINTRQKTYNPVIDSEEKFSKLWSLQKQITFAIIDSLGIVLTPEERNAISRVPTENYEAFLAYCNGIAEKDQGNYDAAGQYFNQAVLADPNFGQAVDMKEEAGLLEENGGNQDEFESTLGSQIGGETLATGFDTDVTGEFEDLTENGVDNNDTVPVEDVTGETGTVSVGGTIR
jgi:tetratricopeptide (TPR) repeat protein